MGRNIERLLDLHEVLLVGLPVAALTHFIDNQSCARASAKLGLGTMARIAGNRAEYKDHLKPEYSAQLRILASVLASAIEALGSRREAEKWLSRPGFGLEGHRPVDLIRTPPGRYLVSVHISGMSYGIYA